MHMKMYVKNQLREIVLVNLPFWKAKLDKNRTTEFTIEFDREYYEKAGGIDHR